MCIIITSGFHNVAQTTLFDTKGFHNVAQTTLLITPLETMGFFIGEKMIAHGIYFGKKEYYDLIREIGGTWNDSKERPIVCMIESLEHTGLYWAIPIGKWSHRDKKAQERIQKFMSYPDDDLRSCYYHVGKTDEQSIFFISDVVPIMEEYIERDYIGKNMNSIFIIKNKELIKELERKLSRIIAFENGRPNYFRQHIADLKEYLITKVTTL